MTRFQKQVVIFNQLKAQSQKTTLEGPLERCFSCLRVPREVALRVLSMKYTISVCKSWKVAARSKDFYKVKCIYDHISASDKEMSFNDFSEIFKLLVPKLKYAKILRSRVKTNYNRIFALGRFEYNIIVNNKQENILMNILATRAESIETLKINSFCGLKKKQWKNFFQVNWVTSFKFVYPVKKDQKLFFKNSQLPNSLERVGIDFEYELRNVMDESNCCRFIHLILKTLHFTFCILYWINIK